MGKKRLTKEERQEEILNNSLEIIYKEGFHNLTIRNIAEKINLSEAAIYRHFKNKEAIINGLLNKVFDQGNLKLNTTKSLKEILIYIIESHVKKLKKDPYLVSLIFQEEIFREYPNIQKRFIKYRQNKQEIIEKLIRKEQQNRNIPEDIDPTSFAIIFMGSLRMLVLKWESQGFKSSIEKQSKKVLNELFKLLRRG